MLRKPVQLLIKMLQFQLYWTDVSLSPRRMQMIILEQAVKLGAENVSYIHNMIFMTDTRMMSSQGIYILSMGRINSVSRK